MKSNTQLLLVALALSATAATAAETRPYTDAEAEMLRLTNAAADARTGWKDTEPYEVSANDVRRAGNNFDWWNPLWDDREYARKTRYGDIIAPPFFLSPLAGAGLDMTVVPGVGNWRGANDGGTWVLFGPVKPGDAIRVWQERPLITDVTQGDGPRSFQIDTTWTFINQDDEKVASFTSFLTNSFTQGNDAGPPGGGAGGPPAGPPPGFGNRERTRYTDADWELIDSIAHSEVIRGAEPRYWEDVKVGDTLQAVIAEPTTVIDMIKLGGDMIMTIPPLREMPRELGKELSQDEYGVYHQQVEGHFTPVNSDNSIHFMAFGESVMGRLVTNWMGDDGWMREFDAGTRNKADRIAASSVLSKKGVLGGHGVGGDAVVGRGEVVRKYQEGDAHLVELTVWTEHLAGQVWQTATVTVELPSRQ